MGSSWFVSDAEPWRTEENYNPDVIGALNCVARKLAQDGGVEVNLLDCVAPVIGAEMSKSQRLRVLYVVCLCLAAEDPPDAALPPLGEPRPFGPELGHAHHVQPVDVRRDRDIGQ